MLRGNAPELKFLSVARVAARENVRGKAVDLQRGQHLHSAQLMEGGRGSGNDTHFDETGGVDAGGQQRGLDFGTSGLRLWDLEALKSRPQQATQEPPSGAPEMRRRR